MIKHHQGAIDMVNDLFKAYGAAQDDTIYKFASDVFADQSIEIEVMRKMLATVDMICYEWSVPCMNIDRHARFENSCCRTCWLELAYAQAPQSRRLNQSRRKARQPKGRRARGGATPNSAPPPPAVMPPPVTPIVSMTAPNPDPRVGLAPGRWDAAQAAWNMRMISTTPPSASSAGATHSDLAFMRQIRIQGNYNGFEIWDISNPAEAGAGECLRVSGVAERHFGFQEPALHVVRGNQQPAGLQFRRRS